MSTVQHTDVVIVGAGIAGVAAATAAARKGSKVTLIERSAWPGGKATSAEVGTVCGLYKFSKTERSGYIVKGFAKEFAEALQKASGTKPLHNADGLHYLPYDIEAFKHICLQLLKDDNIRVHFNSSLDSIEVENDMIKSAGISNGSDRTELHFRSIIDCSGDSIISQAANLPVIRSEQYQAAAQVFTMEGVAEENEARLGLILMKALRSAIDEKRLPDFYDRVYIVQGSVQKNRVSLKVGIPLAVTHTDKNLGELKAAALSFVETLSTFLVSHVPAFKNAAIEHIAPEVGVRVGLRSMGKYILTEEDVLGCKKMDDAIANAAWPIEEWEQHKRVKMRYFKPEDYYQIPVGCLQSKFISNLFMGGRDISASNAAIASARVMGICLQTGYAAGCLASALASGLPESDAINSIQSEQL